ncbi:hypothetical protein PQX77_012015 [Marasmius sp. AFHP31]|nr:hypothetical protein PQX77_012015 [Marasmius sp. AFHP31]
MDAFNNDAGPQDIDNLHWIGTSPINRLESISFSRAYDSSASTMSTQEIGPGWVPQYNHSAAVQNLNHGRDQNINHRGYQNITSGGQVGQVVGEMNYAGRDITNHYHSTIPNPSAYERLVNITAGVGASHKAEQQFDRGCCLPGTRVAALKAIHDWRSSKQQEHPICWLSGAAGVGKSAIAMTVSRECETEGVLASSFFFFRSDPNRNKPAPLIPTIAHDLTYTTSLMRSRIEQSISEDPRILEATLEDQFRELIFKPALSWGRQRSRWGFFTDLPGSPVVSNIVIIDGLDECGNEEAQLRILSIIQSAYQQAPDFPLRFLICSRPESWIQEAFADEPLFRLSRTVVLDDSLEAREDIRRYFVHHFGGIAASRKYRQVRFPNPWPSKEDLETLVERSCGQFVYALTVIKFIRLASNHPITQLRIILDIALVHQSQTSPYPELDALYDLILSGNPDREELLPILAAILVLPDDAKSPACIEMLFELPVGQVTLTLRAMHSILNVGGWENDIKLYHTSFRDYLAEQTRSRHFHINIPTWTNDIARRWLQHLTTSKIWTFSFDQLHGQETKRFFTEWFWFCIDSIAKPSRELLEDLWNVDLAFPYLVGEASWQDLFADPLVFWAKKYRDQGISGNEEELGLMNRLMHKFRHLPRCFHLEWPPGVYLSEETVCWVIAHTIGLRSITSLGITEPSASQWPRLTECDCDLSRDNGLGDTWHRAYREACMQVFKFLVSHFERLARSVEVNTTALRVAFLDLTNSRFLRHCCLDTEPVLLCRTFLELATECSALKLGPSQEARVCKNLLAWVETLPDTLAEEMKAQVLALPWAQWTQAYINGWQQVTNL